MRHRFVLRRLTVALILLLATAATALGGPNEVLLDYQDNGSIDQQHSLADLRAALAQSQDTSLYGSFRDAVQAELNEQIGGVRSPGGNAPPAAPARPDAEPGAPVPPAESSGGTATTPDTGAVAGATGGGEGPGRPGGGGASSADATPSASALEARARPRSSTDAEATADAARDISGLSARRELPRPPNVAAGDGVPLIFVGLSAAAGALVLAGIASAVYRRAGGRRAR